MAESKVLTQVKNIVSKTLKLPLEKVDVDADFDSFGMDSIIAMELMSNLSKEMNISITPAQFTEVNTIKELATTIEEITVEDDQEEVPAQVIETTKATQVIQEPVYREISKSPERVRKIDTQRSTVSRNNEGVNRNVLERIQQEFSIDLSYRKFRTIEEVADTLVTGHLDELLNHYNIIDETIDAPLEMSQHPNVSGTNRQTVKIDQNDIAIVGISCNFPDAPNAPAYWKNLIDKKNSIREIPSSRWDWKKYYAEEAVPGKTNSKWAALIDNFDCFDAAFFGIHEEEALLMDPQERLLLQEAYKAFQDGGINPAHLKGTNTGVYVSYEYSEYEHYLRNNIDRLQLGDNLPVFSSSSPTYYLANRISFVFDFNGPSESFNVNCAGSAVAINRAYHALLNGESDLAVVGGVSLNMFAEDYIALSKYGMLSPDGSCAVFDEAANGFTRGEGVASVVLKRLSDAEKDNNKIYGVIKNSHQNNRGKARFMQEVDTESITNVISNCYEDASIEPQNVDYIEVDGYATKWGDSFEYEGIKNAFKQINSKNKSCALGSLKGNLGNLESVNGLAALIKLSLSMQHKKFPATISKKKTNTFIDLDNPKHPIYFADNEIPFDTLRKDEHKLIRAGINSFADTGVNVHILLEEYQPKNGLSGNRIPKDPQLFVLSAKDQNRLLKSIDTYVDFLPGVDASQFLNIVYTSQIGREALEERLVIICNSLEELIEKLEKARNGVERKNTSLEKDGIFFGSAQKANENPLNGIFTDDMAQMLIEQTSQKDRWEKLAKLWITGLEVPWKSIWNEIQVHPISLPLYPFYETRYWVEISGEKKPLINLNGNSQNNQKSIKESEEAKVTSPEWFFYVTEGKSESNQFPRPKERMVLFLQQQIGLLLKVPILKVDTKTNFLELGLNSIDIGTFVSNTMNLLDITMSPAIIFNNTDINSLAGYLTDTYAEKVQRLVVTTDEKEAKSKKNATAIKIKQKTDTSLSVLVPLQPTGSETPIFAVSPGGNGTTLAFQHLVKALGAEQPFYGLEFAMPENAKPEEITIEKIAKENVNAIQKIQSKGPYRLLGLSNGGMIAFEMAKILHKKKEKIELISFLDSFSPKQKVIDIVDEIIGVFQGKFTTSPDSKLELDADKLRKLPEREQFDYLYDAICKNGFTIPKEQFSATYEIAKTMDASCRAYKPSKLTSRINTVLFRATEGYMEGYEELPEDYGWNKLFTNRIQINPIEADHFSITEKAQSEEIARTIKELLKKPVTSKK
ncbi:beta-ketoacyl synthase N-terminal-like domain-containing protein [Flavobacteriaceae bacterium M23B6Z8]